MPHAFTFDENSSRIITSFQSSNIFAVKAQNGHQTSKASCRQTFRSNVSWVDMAADTAKTDGAIGNECLKPKHPAAKVAETPNSLPLQDSTCAAAVCVDIDPPKKMQQQLTFRRV